MKVICVLLQPYFFAPWQDDSESLDDNVNSLRETTKTFYTEDDKRDEHGRHDEAEETDPPVDVAMEQFSKFNDSWKHRSNVCVEVAAAIDILAKDLIKLSVFLFQRSKSNEEIVSASARFMCRHLSLDLQVKY